MVFDRKDYGMNKGIPFVHIGDSVDVIVDLKGKRVSGPPLVFKQEPATLRGSRCGESLLKLSHHVKTRHKDFSARTFSGRKVLPTCA